MEKLAAKPVAEAAAFLKKFSPQVPDAAVVLGSGVKVLEDLEESRSISYEEVFGVSPGVVGHSGALSIGKIDGKTVAVLRGRFHFYEGHPWSVVTLPAQTLVEWGVPKLYLTNAAGGINQNFNVGDLMVITGYRDHLNEKYKESGLLSQLKKAPVSCSNSLTDQLIDTARKLHAKNPAFRALQAGVYVGLLGPNYETLAEIELLKYLKCDAVGMSTVPELLACEGSKTQAAALSVITNVWKPEEAVGGHEEVLTAAKEASERLDILFREAIRA
ncbi:MAG: purine-nucleoside phosphorylase [Candidatus Obscuribacterales bacterium]|nr:purine-nucleoside phosphorylase [Candidatus Obscuribacterales bacterium]